MVIKAFGFEGAHPTGNFRVPFLVGFELFYKNKETKIFQERGFNRCQLSLQGTKLKGKKKKRGGFNQYILFSTSPLCVQVNHLAT